MSFSVHCGHIGTKGSVLLLYDFKFFIVHSTIGYTGQFGTLYTCHMHNYDDKISPLVRALTFPWNDLFSRRCPVDKITDQSDESYFDLDAGHNHFFNPLALRSVRFDRTT